MTVDEPTLRVMALHALAYCERLFYLEEVEEIRVADERVYAGRTLHEALDESGDFVRFTHESATLGLRGRVDALRRRDGTLIPYEHKRGRSRAGPNGPEAWDSDRLQVAAYALLVEEATREPVSEGRVRYHADRVTVRVDIDASLRRDVREAVARARLLRKELGRPPVTVHEGRCAACSLAPVCLPEESRKARDAARPVARLHPRDDDRTSLHITEHGTRVGRRGHELVVTPPDADAVRVPIRTIRSLACHGHVQVSAQALALCADHGVAVHWFGAGGWYKGTFHNDADSVQRKLRQYEALREPGMRVALARSLVIARVEGQLRFIMRGTRGKPESRQSVAAAIGEMREVLAAVSKAEGPEQLLGHEGRAARAYFSALPSLIRAEARNDMGPRGRSRRPPEDPFNALLSFGYGLLLREVHQAVRVVGLEPAIGFYHLPRTSAPPLVLDLMELFRVPCVDLPVVGAVNRRQFDAARDFERAGRTVWLTREGKKKAIALFEARLGDLWKHPVLGYSLSYRRHIELEVRLLEKEWSGEGGLFARARLR